jgi:trans-aconitate methyltransferase
VLSRLLAADGMDTGFGNVEEGPWRQYVLQAADSIGIDAESSVFEVGCGAGAWLYELGRLGCEIGGLDTSPALIGYAHEHLPNGRWHVGDASALETVPRYDFVVSSGVFLYFPSLEYAQDVLRRMVAKAKKGVLVLDVPDLATRDAALAERHRIVGEESYRSRYAGLDHLYFDRSWFQSALASLDVLRVQIVNQSIDGYVNSRYRFNVSAWLR